MWKIDSKYLQSDEQLEYADRPSRLSCITAYIWFGLIMLFLLVSLIAIIIGIISPVSRTAVLQFLEDYGYLLVILVVAALPALYVILKRLSTYYAITNKGLIQRKGIIVTNIKSVPFEHIISTRIKETIRGKIFRYANLIIDISGSGRAVELKWNYLTGVHSAKKLIEMHIQEMQPLHKVAVTPIDQKAASMAKASFIIAMIVTGVFILIYATVWWHSAASISSESKLIIMLFGLVAFIGSLVGACLGFATIKKNFFNKWMATTGIIVNFLQFVIIIILIIIGAYAK